MVNEYTYTETGCYNNKNNNKQGKHQTEKSIIQVIVIW